MPADADGSAQDAAAAAAAAAAARRLRPAAAGHGPLILLAGGQRFDRVKGGDASQESFGSGFSAAHAAVAAARRLRATDCSEASSYRQPGGCELQTVRLRIRRRCKRRRRQLGGCELQRWAADSTSWKLELRPRRRLQIDRRRRLRAAPAAIRSLERHEGWREEPRIARQRTCHSDEVRQ